MPSISGMCRSIRIRSGLNWWIASTCRVAGVQSPFASMPAPCNTLCANKAWVRSSSMINIRKGGASMLSTMRAVAAMGGAAVATDCWWRRRRSLGHGGADRRSCAVHIGGARRSSVANIGRRRFAARIRCEGRFLRLRNAMRILVQPWVLPLSYPQLCDEVLVGGDGARAKRLIRAGSWPCRRSEMGGLRRPEQPSHAPWRPGARSTIRPGRPAG